jgi:hypothetical protein
MKFNGISLARQPLVLAAVVAGGLIAPPGLGAPLAEFTQSLTSPDASFGWSVAIDGSTIVVGTLAGLAHVYNLEAGQWTWQQQIGPFPFVDGDVGRAVDISGDKLIIGGGTQPFVFPEQVPQAVSVYQQQRGTWQWFWGLTSGEDGDAYILGKDVAIDGDIWAWTVSLAYFPPGTGHVFAAVPTGRRDAFATVDVEPFGCPGFKRLAVSDNMVAVACPEDLFKISEVASVSVYALDGTDVTTMPTPELNHPSEFGTGLSGGLALNGNTLMVGAYSTDESLISYADYIVFVLELHDGQWVQTQVITLHKSGVGLGIGGLIAIHGDVAAITGTGGLHFYMRNPAGQWVHVEELEPPVGLQPGDWFSGLDIDDDGAGGYTVVISAPNSVVVPVSIATFHPPTPDLTGDGTVDGIDLALLLGMWGPCLDCEADLNIDDVVNGLDLAILLAAWG